VLKLENRYVVTFANPNSPGMLMAGTPLSRKLAVILHADVVDSTLLVQQNETLAHECILSAFQRFSETITNYGGRAREIRGDALVAEFERASDAVAAALAFQCDNAKCNAVISDGLQPWMRIGISLGEVVIADNTITGAGVVLAQRLEQQAEAGGICIQGAAYETIPQRLPFEYTSLGEQRLKGFQEPVRVFAVALKSGEDIPVPDLPSAADAVEQLPRIIPNSDKPRILIMPFVDASIDGEQDYFTRGITDNIITLLTSFKELFVFAFNTSMQAASQINENSDAWQKLDARYVVEGTIQRMPERIRITARLIDAQQGQHLWAKNYDRDAGDFFAVQDEIAGLIVSSLVGKVEETDWQRAQQKSQVQLQPYDLVLKGRISMSDYSREGVLEARNCFLKAIELDSSYASAYAGMAVSYAFEYLGIWCEHSEQTRIQMVEYANKALQLDKTNIMARYARAFSFFWGGEYERAVAEVEQAVECNPNDYHSVCLKGWILTYSGQLQEGLQCTTDAMRTNPLAADACLEIIGTGEYLSGNYDQALNAFGKIKSEGFHKLGGLAACYAQMGRTDEAGRVISQIKANDETNHQQERWQDFWNRVYKFKNASDREHFLDGMKKAGILGGFGVQSES
jgi:adenylate cyclase